MQSVVVMQVDRAAALRNIVFRKLEWPRRPLLHRRGRRVRRFGHIPPLTFPHFCANRTLYSRQWARPRPVTRSHTAKLIPTTIRDRYCIHPPNEKLVAAAPLRYRSSLAYLDPYRRLIMQISLSFVRQKLLLHVSRIITVIDRWEVGNKDWSIKYQ